MSEKLNIDVMRQLGDIAVASGGSVSSTERTIGEVPAMLPEVIGVLHVAVTMEATQQVADIEVGATLGKPMGSRTRCWIRSRR